jgi:hypothetical protein
MSRPIDEAAGTITEVIHPIDLSHPRIQEFHTYWQDHHDDNGEMPGLVDMDLMQIYKLAPWITILDVVPGDKPSLQFKWRYAGTQLYAILFGVELTGQFVHSHSDAEWAGQVQACYEHVVSTSSPHMWRCKINAPSTDSSLPPYTRLLLPLLDKHGDVGHLIGIYAQDDPE